MKMRLSKLFILFLAVTMAACAGGDRGQVIGVQDRPTWNNVVPFGMVYIPSGSFHIGPGDQDVNHSLIQRHKQISVQGFFMDDTEITNNEYRQFVHWVRDSIAAKSLGGDYLLDEGTDDERINWEAVRRLDWNDEENLMVLEEMFVPEGERFWGARELDVSELWFEYFEIDWQRAAHDRSAPRSELVMPREIQIYPDTLVWIRDFAYSYNEPMTRNYFWHPAFDDYPVVGVTWEQANAFSAWRTKIWADYRSSRGEPINDPFRLPTEHEWEYAARGGKELAPYPWGGPYLRNSKGCILANFKPGRGNYSEDGGFYTVRADAYWPNDYGLYNMAGNVAEWTSTSFREGAYSFIHDMNPDIRYDADENDPITMKRKVIRGGSWKDIGYFLQTGTRAYEYQDTAKSYVGFRNVLTFLGRSIND